MAKILPAICKALATFAGPLGFPGEFVLRIYDDQRADERDAMLLSSMENGKELTREVLEEIFESKQLLEETRSQFIDVMSFLIPTLMNRELIPDSNSKKGANRNSLSENLEEKIIMVLKQERQTLQETLLTQDLLMFELNRLYNASRDSFLAVIGIAGFPIGNLPGTGSPLKVIIFQFLKECEGLTLDQLIRIFDALFSDKPGSDILKKAASNLHEIASATENVD